MESFVNFHPFPSIFKDSPLQALVGSEKKSLLHPSRSLLMQRFPYTILCVLNYLYTRTYDVLHRSPATKENQECRKEDRAQVAMSKSSSWSQFLSSSDSNTEAHNEALLERPANQLRRSLQTSSQSKTKKAEENVDGPSSKRGTIFDEHLGNIALLHAKVYCFAHQFMFSELEELSCQRLKQVLHESDVPSDLFFRPLAEAIRLVYGSTLAQDSTNPARTLLYQYVAFNYPRLSDAILGPLVAEGGDFAVDLSRKLAEKAQSYHSCIEKLEAKLKTLELRDIERTLKLSESMGLWSMMHQS
ncbi:uncharacterized protein N7483_002684 [Penicillium malachiteum]|uniref:uncharacterized protein n=1 Tax=Penicillium malachiteum TaxID=1324776 RepID=UPI0025465A6D|nr:uncharacterized protein N7483_002684 [Penicillium malachiteum]KAJ5737559.1 hypothetical protein N7483_002684 [Penicillium malachiteum]